MKFFLALALLLNYNLFESTKANRLLVVTEPTWCEPCRRLEPHLIQLKKEGYDIHRYTREEWKRAKPKPGNLPTTKSVPLVMYVSANKNANKVVRHHSGGQEVTSGFMKRYLTK